MQQTYTYPEFAYRQSAEQREGRVARHPLVIVGAGPIGLATLEFTRLTGARITVMDMVPSRLDFCRQTYGIEHTVVFTGDATELEAMRSITSGDMYSLVTDATGNHRHQ